MNQFIKKEKYYNLFIFCYILLYISYFVGDINIPDVLQGNIGKYLRIISYSLIIIYFLTIGIYIRRRKLGVFFIVIMASLLFYVLTGDLYFSIILIFAVAAKNIDSCELIKTSYYVLLIGTVIVILSCVLGFIDNANTIRNSVDIRPRSALGFYHSNVLPLELVYLTSYRILIKKNKMKNSELFFIAFIGTVLYKICNSRNAYVSLILLLIMVAVVKNIKQKKFIEYIIIKLSQVSVFVVYIFSLSMMYLLLRGGIWNIVESFFSGRFRSAIFKSRIVGIHFINIMSDREFFADGIILDNGYLYAFLRYGIIMIAVIFYIHYMLVKRIKGNIYSYIVLLVLAIANMVDNDLFDYGCLPFILIAFTEIKRHKNKWLEKT